ncbi:MAG TPA: hypothetical protein VKD21_11590, partial [Acidimicrobiales bacterium]|nr:hypothetical protein [Acidimicrobiales bacterium]
MAIGQVERVGLLTGSLPGAASAALRRGVFGAVLTLVSLALVPLLAAPPFLELDETGHVAYGVAVSEGRLPSITEPADTGMPTQRDIAQRHGAQPPLYYVLIAPIVGAGSGSDAWAASVRGARAVSLLSSVVTVVATAAIAGLLVRRRRAETMVLAAGLTTSLALFVGISAFVRNDSLSLAGAAVALVGAFAALQRGPAPRWVALACLGSAWTMASRFNGVILVGLVALALASSGYLWSAGSALARAGRAALLGALPVASVIATSGWFYWRNYRLYGDITSSARQLELAGNPESSVSLGRWLLEPTAVPTVLLGAQGGHSWASNLFSPVEDALLIAALVLVASGAARRLRSGWADRRAARRPEPGDGEDSDGEVGDGGDSDAGTAARRSRLVTLLICVALPLSAWYQLSLWVSYGGTPLSRYLLVALPVLATGAAAACLGHPGAMGRLVGLFVVSLQATFAVLWIGRWLGFRWPDASGKPLTDLVDALDRAGMPRPGLVLVLLAAGAAAGIILQAVALWSLGRRDVGPGIDGQGDGASLLGGPPAVEPLAT